MIKTILITGGGGFIGHHLVQMFLETAEYKVISLDRSLSVRLEELKKILPSNLTERLYTVQHDLRNPIDQTVADKIESVDYIIHTAGNASVAASIVNPLSSVIDNVIGTCNILEYARLYLPNIKKFINIGTNEIFGKANSDTDFYEYDRYNSQTPYGASKAGAEELCVAYKNTYKLPISCVHIMNVFGERQDNKKYILTTIRKILNNEPVIVNPGINKWMYISDVCSAVKFILNLDISLPHCQKFNVVGQEEISNLVVAQTISKILNKPLICNSMNNQVNSNDFRYSMNGDYIKSLGWEPVVSFQTGMKNTIEWALKNTRWM